MTEQHHDDKHLHDDLGSQSPLSRLYQQLPADAPSANTDETILAAARHATRRKARFTRWSLPMAIAAMLLIGLSLLWWQQYQAPSPLNNTVSEAPVTQQASPQKLDQSLHNNPAADHWLEQILKLHKAGKTVQAAEQFHRFRKAYPVYTIDAQRFGALQAYDK